MKSPKLAEIPDATPRTSFAERSKAAKQQQEKAARAVKISVTVMPEHESYIHKHGLKLAQQRGKNVSTSEALRSIIDDHRSRS